MTRATFMNGSGLRVESEFIEATGVVDGNKRSGDEDPVRDVRTCDRSGQLSSQCILQRIFQALVTPDSEEV